MEEEQTLAEENYMFSTEPSQVEEESQDVDYHTRYFASLLAKAPLHVGTSPTFDADIGSDVEVLSSSDSSTVMSESTPHWVDYFETDPWADNLRPSIELPDYDHFFLEEEEADEDNEKKQEGEFLTDCTIIKGLSFPSACPVFCNYSLNKLKLSEKGLADIKKIENYKYLQYIDLSHNHLSDLTPLGNLPFLMYLDVSHNQLTTVLSFQAPLNLTYVNLSHNHISNIDKLTQFWSLMKLDLSHNRISKIEGLQSLRYLRVLDLSHNLIERFENLNYLRITHLFLQNNKISEFEEGDKVSMKTLHCICHVDLDHNKLKSLALFKDCISVEKISLVGNQIGEVFEMENLKASVNLKELNLLKNPVIEWPEYRGMAIGTVPSLCMLDGISVSSDEKVKSKNTFDPDIRLVAARNHSLLLIMEQLNNPNIHPYIFPVDEKPLPLLVLVGPVGSMKGNLARHIASVYENKVYVAVSHTSRNPTKDEIGGYHYHFVSRDKINELALDGHFLTFTEILGESYGLDRTELTNAFDKQCLCIASMDLVGATALVHRGLKPYLVLTISQSEEIHRKRIKVKPYITTSCETELAPASDNLQLIEKSRMRVQESIFTDSFLGRIIECGTKGEGSFEDEQALQYHTSDMSLGQNLQPKKTIEEFKETIFSDAYFDVITTSDPTIDESKFYNKTNDKSLVRNPQTRKTVKEFKEAIFSDEYLDYVTRTEPTFEEYKETIFTDSLLDCIVEKKPYKYKLEHEKHCKQCAFAATSIKLTLQSREDYFKTYAQNRDFFSSVIYTDDIEDAYDKLVKIVKDVYRSVSKSPPLFIKETDKFKASIPNRLKYYMNKLNKHHQVYEQEKSNSQDNPTSDC